MKCPNCGLEIPEGHMYCDNCGTEINFVPEFEPEVENEINETLSSVADELNKEERLKEERTRKRREFFEKLEKRRPVILVCVGVVLVLLLAFMLFTLFSDKSSYYYIRKAEKAKSSGSMNKAIEYLIEGNVQLPENTDIIYRLSDYYLEMGDSDKAVESLLKITDTGRFSEDKVIAAYESMISIYEQEQSYDKIAELLSATDNAAAAELRGKYIPKAPQMGVAGGEFDDIVVVALLPQSKEDGDSTYYTVNDGDPSQSSILYENEIVLDEEGEYLIKAATFNKYGISSAVAEEKYIVNKGIPSPPEIMEPSGDYNQNTMIVAVADAGCTIFYTTDGSDPTVESKQYISPITMPVGTSHYKFVAIDSEGVMSEIVERDYHLVFTRLISKEQAVNSLVSTLVRLDILLDNTGKVRGIEGHNEYIYNSEIEIEGAGEYYVVVENHVSNDGVSTPTGLLYAVNTHDGSVNRLGYDSSGKYTLIKISNR
ncbi:chitobiase/beta-hexosaminidase C-terminal domain-containing protein [Butyrivibrio sp. VCB2006]|uniref:chitobiase/beta-hexosaminidase C-terminal domain-containing protein n=1 Tax=Butyrivibrio sp. VCB2006 TaxID=1280679 RepID=UPI0003F63988|nr:chitobiase/beta-hexosaminidase C-terminal domain-containing protein [Butyrivibrio sp. VCB2006]